MDFPQPLKHVYRRLNKGSGEVKGHSEGTEGRSEEAKGHSEAEGHSGRDNASSAAGQKEYTFSVSFYSFN